MGIFKVVTLLSIVVTLASSPVSGSILSWFTGQTATESPPLPSSNVSDNLKTVNNRSPIIQYPEESGECSHWGNAAVPPYGTRDPLFDLSKGVAVPGELIGSHRRVPIGTIVTVTNMKNGNTVRVRVVPPKTTPILGRIMDLSPAAFAQVENVREGVFTCTVKVIQTPRTEMTALTSHVFDSGIKGSRPTAFVPNDAPGYGRVEGLGMFGRSAEEEENQQQYRPHLPVNYY